MGNKLLDNITRKDAMLALKKIGMGDREIKIILNEGGSKKKKKAKEVKLLPEYILRYEYQCKLCRNISFSFYEMLTGEGTTLKGKKIIHPENNELEIKTSIMKLNTCKECESGLMLMKKEDLVEKILSYHKLGGKY